MRSSVCVVLALLLVPSIACAQRVVSVSPGSTFVDHPRLLLTGAKRRELASRRVANTPEWAAVKSLADDVSAAFPGLGHQTTLTASLGRGGAGTTFAVLDGSAFPTGRHMVRVDLEILMVTRAGNTFTIVARGMKPAALWDVGTETATHAPGAEVWEYAYIEPTNLAADVPAMAVLEHAGLPGYEQGARALVGQLLAVYGMPAHRRDGNAIRWGWYHIAIGYDWVYAHLSLNEKQVFSAAIEDTVAWHLAHAKECITWTDLDCATLRQRRLETVLTGNIANGQLRSELALAAAIYGDHASALSDWNAAYAKVEKFLVPSISDGAFSGGNNSEGSEYGPQAQAQTVDIFNLIISATGTDRWPSQTSIWHLNLAKFLLYVTLPGATNSVTTTTGTIAAGSRNMTVADVKTFAIGQQIIHRFDGNPTGSSNLVVDATINTDVTPDGYTPVADDVNSYVDISVYSPAPWKGGRFQITAIVGGKWRLNRSPAPTGTTGGVWRLPFAQSNVVTAISGKTITLRDPAVRKSTVAGNQVAHRSALMTYGDNENTNNNFDDAPFNGDFTWAGSGLIDHLRTDNPTYAGYLRYWMDTTQAVPNNLYKWIKLVYYDRAVTPVDYTAAGLPICYATPHPTSTGLMLCRSDWGPTASFAYFLVGGEAFEHATQAANTFGFSRKNVWGNRPLTGYGPSGLSNPLVHGAAFRPYGDAPYTGFWTHNGLAMNDHGPASPVHTMDTKGPAALTRSEITKEYGYARGDASGVYSSLTTEWTHLGYPNNDARTAMRDWLYLPGSDTLVIHDWTTYANATLSPTQWNFIYPGDVVRTGSQMLMLYGGEKFVHDQPLPDNAAFTKTNLKTSEDMALDGFRMEVRSGVSTNTEYGLSVFRAMDSSTATPAAPINLTTTNANVYQFDRPNVVVGFVKGAVPAGTITYTYRGSPSKHYVVGLGQRTAYHLTNIGATVTIASATGSGDTTTTAAGILEF